MTKPRSFSSKILAPESLARRLAAERRKGRRVVFTNGCFDIIHEGHVTYLAKARALGDVLVVAMDTDAAVRSQKGPERPINDLKSRQKVLASLECVDFVTHFGGSNPVPTIKKLRPDVLVKGGDWSVDKILGAKEVMGWGGMARSLPFVDGRSTTNIVKKIKAGARR